MILINYYYSFHFITVFPPFSTQMWRSYTSVLMMLECISATPLTAWDPTMHRCAMFTLLHPSSSIRDIFLSLSMSFGKRAAILCGDKAGLSDIRFNADMRTQQNLILWCQSRGAYIEVDLVDLVDDLQVSGQEGRQQIYGPALQSFREDCVVGVGKSASGEVPGLQRRGITSHLSCAINALRTMQV